MKTCYQQIELIETAESFILQGKNKEGDSSSLEINRSNNSIKSLGSDFDASSVKKISSQKLSAVLGSIELLAGFYLVVVKSATPVATIDKVHTINSIGEVKIIPYYQKPVPTQHQADESRYLELLTTILNDGTFYFSYTYDATVSTQNWFKQASTLNVVGDKSDDHFLWNGFLTRDFAGKEDAKGWFVPTICGFVETKEAEVEDKSFNLTILSRLGCKRVGTRYNMRGADFLGNVANFVETEQIIEYNNNFISFMQLRGSIPLLWTQKANIQYKPPTYLKKEGKSFEKHFDGVLPRYQNIVIVNLINQKGSEKVLADEYEVQYKSYPKNSDLKYIAFDFHNKCKSMNYSAIAELTDQVEPSLKSQGYFHMNVSTGQILSEQTGIVRSNCIDCLDRTNVCQSIFAKIVLASQLNSLNVIPSGQKVADQKSLNYTFQNIWADNGDRVSFIYAGTGAIKADFTRTGKRTLNGLLNDGINSATRYYLNNFKDGIKQDSVNLLLGKYVVKSNAKSPFDQENQSNVFFSVLKYGFFVSLFMVAASTSKATTSGGLVNLLIYLALTVIIYFLLVKNGRKIVNNPSLIDPTEETTHSKQQ